MGWEAFTTGLKLYFKEFKWRNTTLLDFMGKLQEGYELTYKPKENEDKLDLNEWSDKWLRTKGPNKISYEYTHEEGIITSFKIR